MIACLAEIRLVEKVFVLDATASQQQKAAELAIRISSWPCLLLESLGRVGNQTGLTGVLHHMKIATLRSTGIKKKAKRKKKIERKQHIKGARTSGVRIWRLIHG